MQDGINQYRLIDDGGSVDWHEQAPSAGSKHFRITDAITREAANNCFPTRNNVPQPQYMYVYTRKLKSVDWLRSTSFNGVWEDFARPNNETCFW